MAGRVLIRGNFLKKDVPNPVMVQGYVQVISMPGCSEDLEWGLDRNHQGVYFYHK